LEEKGEDKNVAMFEKLSSVLVAGGDDDQVPPKFAKTKFCSI
jgi:hypothetical protein